MRKGRRALQIGWSMRAVRSGPSYGEPWEGPQGGSPRGDDEEGDPDGSRGKEGGAPQNGSADFTCHKQAYGQ